jgi:hypothetical protein
MEALLGREVRVEPGDQVVHDRAPPPGAVPGAEVVDLGPVPLRRSSSPANSSVVSTLTELLAPERRGVMMGRPVP